MPTLVIQLTQRTLNFTAREDEDEWLVQAVGKFEISGGGNSFKIICGDAIYDGFGAYIHITFRKRLPRSEKRGIPTSRPYDDVLNEDELYRDVAFVTTPPDSGSNMPFISLVISLPHDVYQRIINADLTNEVVKLSISKFSWGQGYVFGPDAHKIEWLTDKEEYVFLDEVTLHFSQATQSDNIEAKKSQDTEKNK